MSSDQVVIQEGTMMFDVRSHASNRACHLKRKRESDDGNAYLAFCHANMFHHRASEKTCESTVMSDEI